jgi:hypothetical protein
MSLPAQPTFTPGSPGNIYASNSLAASASITTSAFYIGVAGQTGAQGSTTTGSALSGHVQVWNTGGATVSAGSGLQVQAVSTSDGTNYDTVALGGVNFVIATSVSTTAIESFELPPGQYKLKLTNTDTANAITVEATLGTTA